MCAHERKTLPLPQTRHNRLSADLLFHQPLSPHCLHKHNPSFIFQQKTNIKCMAFCITSATVYLPGSCLLLFLHVPDIIIAVRGMIICLLWKLADCLSPVPEELPLKGVPLEKHHRSGFSAGRIRNAEDRKTPERQEATARKRERVAVPLC